MPVARSLDLLARLLVGDQFQPLPGSRHPAVQAVEVQQAFLLVFPGGRGRLVSGNPHRQLPRPPVLRVDRESGSYKAGNEDGPKLHALGPVEGANPNPVLEGAVTQVLQGDAGDGPLLQRVDQPLGVPVLQDQHADVAVLEPLVPDEVADPVY